MINIKDIAERHGIEKPMRAYSEHSDQMLTEGNGWEVIDEDQLTEVQKQIVILNKRKVDPRLQNYNNYTMNPIAVELMI